jgi:tetratricopeptide (TPR) repeat protein
MPAKAMNRRSSTPDRKPAVSARRSTLLWFSIIAGVAFLLRLIHILQLRHNDPLFFSPQMDALYHHQWALAIAAGRQFINDAFFRAPLYPYFLGLLYKLFAANQMAARIIQAALGSATCGLTYLLARQLVAQPQAARMGSRVQGSKGSGPEPQHCRTGAAEANARALESHPSDAVPRIAALVVAAYPLAIWYDSELLLEGLLTFLLVLGFVLLLRSRDSDSRWWLPGLVFGLAAITRPNVLAFLAVLPVWLFLERGRTRPTRQTGLTRLALVWGAAAIVILPVTIRNYVVSRQFVPIAWQAGTNFIIGNNPSSDGTTAIVPGTRGTWWGGYDDVKRLAEQAEGRPLKGAEIDRYWLAKGFQFWREQPGKALGLFARKTFLWFAGHEVGNETDLYVAKRYSFVNYLLFSTRFLKFPFGVLLPLALAGAWLLRSQWRRFLPLYLFIGAYSLSFMVFFVSSRYRTPMVPFVAILAVTGLIGLIGPIPKRERGTALAIAVGAFLLLNANLAGAGRATRADQSHFAAAFGLHEQGRDVEALKELQLALEHDSASNVLTLQSTLLQQAGDFAGAERAARAATRLYPQEADVWADLGNVFANGRQLDSAARYFEVALKIDPYSLQAWVNLGNVNLQRRDFDKARYYYEGALKIRPTYVDAIFYVGLCDYYEGKVTEAHARWQQILKLDPSFTKAKQALEQLR